ncbi:VPA1269 family protein [Pseudomonas syringae]|uniref:VPA1269 family protein n=1 Tax=Pseudomonas syringae TaxID=317 RepID=UPI001010AE65|nr:VPA1269 family protein [Pseudomonas syringae]RXT62639.1 hypothetical protein B1F71_24000 [Pseudomonas syringae]RXT98089.1 hypothetical protein B1F75_01425 [Pseudomonas syringae]
MKSRKIYGTYEEAKAAARALNFKNSSDYVKNYRQDPYLIGDPSRYYPDFVSMCDYLGCPEDPRGKFYSYEEAAEIVREAAITSMKEYYELQATDSRLPTKPRLVYANSWTSCNDFFDHHPKFRSYEEARRVARSFNFRSRYQYIQTCLKVDDRLHTAPDRHFAMEWTGWDDYLGLSDNVEQFSYQEARLLIHERKVQSKAEYLECCESEPLLPKSPELTWRTDWVDWPTFLSHAVNPNSIQDLQHKTAAKVDADRETSMTSGSEQRQLCLLDPTPPTHSQKIYDTFEAAKHAARALGFTSRQDYLATHYQQDRLLPHDPQRCYPEWSGWEDFLGLEAIYLTYDEARKLLSENGVKSQQQYKALRTKYPKLPSQPLKVYRHQWIDWLTFLGNEPPGPEGRKFNNFNEARAAARLHNFKSQSHYIRNCLKVDSRFRTAPDRYFKEWSGWEDYLGISVEAEFLRYEEAKSLMQELGIKSNSEYLKLRETESRLPRMPQITWKEEWIDWPTFLGQRLDPYPTYEQAKEAVKRLDITSEEEYRTVYLLDPLLPKHPYRLYEADWKDWEDYTIRNHKYKTLTEASAAARKLGFSTQLDYENGYHLDPMLPRRPEAEYKFIWKSWNRFYLRPDHYESFEEARSAARALDFCSKRDYVRRCKALDSSLCIEPDKKYEEWTSWHDFLGLDDDLKFLDYHSAMKFVRENNLKTHSQYTSFRKFHEKLPSAPSLVYRDHWIDWPTFLGQREAPYETYQEAKKAVLALGLTTDREYRAHYLDDPRLPKHPYRAYEFDWSNWDDFLSDQEKYGSIELASQQACAMGLTTRQEYEDQHASDPMLPKRPDLYYEGSWPAGGWAEFLSATPLYETAAEAATAARALGLATLNDYNNLRHLDPKLPASPRQIYGSYTTWLNFILPSKCTSLADVKFSIKAIGIKDSSEYRETYKKYACLPAHPERVFAGEWLDWYDTCNIIRPYRYEDAIALLRKLNLPTSGAYKKYVKESGDKKFPLTPEKVYGDEWVNWQAYLGKEEPYTLVTLREPYEKWRFAFAEFLRTAKGTSKAHHLVKFVRDYVKPNNLSDDPLTFFTTPDFDRQDYKEFMLSMPDSKAKQHLATLREFSEYFLENHLSARCPDTNEIVPMAGAVNPFLKISLPTLKSAAPGQTTKPPLAYHHVHTMREWIVPPAAASFSDLKHLQVFENDWVDIDKSLIDDSDPDCVFVENNGRYRIWFPGYWMHTFALASVPIRGVQLAYADSGECDLEIPVMKDGKIVWIENPSPLRGQTGEEGFIKRLTNDEFGMHLTTNKTAEGITGYDVPWMPEELAKWMIRFRNWQSKYNPINRPLPWSECQNTNYSELDRLGKGSNCFLFRDFGAEECAVSFSSRLYRRIAIALYNTAPELASMTGSPENVSDYHSEFTPHAMRVSLITAYVMDFRLPLNVLVKVVGHASMVMTIYYVKTSGEFLREKFNEAEKRYLHKQSKGAYQSLVEGRGQNHAFLTNNEDALKHLAGQVAAGSALYRDYGICLTAASRCGDGSSSNGKFIAVPAGYLGRENCIHCRHFVTGPVFLGGLLSLANEISLCCRSHLTRLEGMQEKQIELRQKIKKLTNDRFDAAQSSEGSDVDYKALIDEARGELISLDGLLSEASVKADMYLADLNAVNKITQECQQLIANRANNDQKNDSTQLIVKSDHEAVIAFEEVSLFRQLNEVCENAEIYTSSSAELAAPQRSNMIDRMAELNRMTPVMYKLDQKSQLVIGNQIVKFMIARMSWPTVEAVMDGSILMKDLPKDQRMTSGALQSLLKGDKAQDVLRIEYNSRSQSGTDIMALTSQQAMATHQDIQEMAR